MISDTQNRSDLLWLMSQPEFRRTLFKLITEAGLFEATANGSDSRNLYAEGRRSLGLDVLRQVEAAQPVPHPDGLPIMTMMQLLREEIDAKPTEKLNARRSRTDQYRELDADGDGSDAS